MKHAAKKAPAQPTKKAPATKAHPKPAAKGAAALREVAATQPPATKQAKRKLPRIKVGIGKRRVVVSFKNLTPELLELLREKYPNGWNDYVIKVNKSETDFFHAVMLETDEASYLVKVDVKIDARPKDDDDILDSVISPTVDSADDIADTTDVVVDVIADDSAADL
ncbi:MAG: hypothetical protein LBF55_03410 [Prevotellaceae bacterium]|nr:hypothetical protein [Prevotellaceae bacterium]